MKELLAAYTQNLILFLSLNPYASSFHNKSEIVDEIPEGLNNSIFAVFWSVKYCEAIPCPMTVSTIESSILLNNKENP